MSWRDRLQPGSFRGIPFQTKSVDTTRSRNVITKSYLLTEDVTSKDLGRQAEAYSFDVFFVGDDYMEQRDTFLAVLDKGTPGPLIHPYYGNREVFYRSCTIREDSEEGRMARLSLSFVEAGKSKFPNIEENRVFKLNASAVNLESVAINDFQAGARLTQVSDFVREGVTSKTDLIFGGMRDLVDAGAFVNSVSSDVLNTSDYITGFAELRSTFNQIINPVPTLISSASTFSTLMSTAFGLIVKSGSNGKAARSVLKTAREAEVVLDTELTEQIKFKNENQKVTERFLKVMGIANEAKSIPDMSFESRTEALTIRDDIVDQLDVLLDSSETDAEYQALKTVKSEVILYLPPEHLDLPQVRSVKLGDTLSALIVSYDLYETVDRESDIISRNKIRHPCFVDPSTALEVLVGE